MKDIIKKYQFRDGLDLEFEIVDLKKVFDKKSAVMTTPHRAQFYHVMWIEKGSGTHYIDFKPISIEDNVIIFIPQNSVNLFDKGGTYEGKAIIFTDDFFCKNKTDFDFLRSGILFNDLYPTTLMRVSPTNTHLTVLLNYMETEFARTLDSEKYSILHNLLHVFLLQAEREMKSQGFEELVPGANLEYLILFKELLDQRFTAEKTVNGYASELGLSDKQLHKACTTLLDKTPKQIIDERILLEAKRLLVHSSHTIKEIAYELGYDEPTNFIKYFKKHIESTPSEFRENNCYKKAGEYN
jgi:AraC-like DNA-binding protein